MYFYSGQSTIQVWCWPSLRSLLAKEGYRQWEDDAIVLVISPLLDLRLMVSHITFVVVPPVRLFPEEIHSIYRVPTDVMKVCLTFCSIAIVKHRITFLVIVVCLSR